MANFVSNHLSNHSASKQLSAKQVADSAVGAIAEPVLRSRRHQPCPMHFRLEGTEYSLQCHFFRLQEPVLPAVSAQINLYLSEASSSDLAELLDHAAELNVRLSHLWTSVKANKAGRYYLELQGLCQGRMDARNFSRFLKMLTQDLNIFFAYAKATHLQIQRSL